MLLLCHKTEIVSTFQHNVSTPSPSSRNCCNFKILFGISINAILSGLTASTERLSRTCSWSWQVCEFSDRDIGSRINRQCSNCGTRQKIFTYANCGQLTVTEKFCEWLFSDKTNKGYTALAHYGSGFDHFFIMDYIHKALAEDEALLREGVLAYRKMQMELTKDSDENSLGLDPFQNCVTIASFCMLVFKTLFLKPDTIANIPEKGYRAFQKTSRQALLKLLYMKKTKAGYDQLQTKMSPGGEHKIELDNGKFYLCDGFIPPTPEDDPHFMGTVIEVNGCHVHGHEKCYPNREDLALNGKTHKQNYEATMKKEQTLKRMGYEVITIWGCDIDKEVKEDRKTGSENGIAAFFKEFHNLTGSLEIRDAFFGGHTEVFRVLAQKIDGFVIRYLDICSLYPFVNRSKSYPIGAPITISENFKEFREGEDIPYKGIIRCSVDPPPNLRFPVLPYRQNDRLFFTLCRKCSHMENKEKCEHSTEERRLHGTWTHFELNHAIARGYKIHHVVEVLHWDEWTAEEGSLFKDYIDTYLKVKQEASGYPRWVQTDEDKLKYIDDYFNAMGIRLDPSKISKNEGLRWIAKLALNSFWGKLGQRADLTQTEYVKDRADLWKLVTTHGQRIVSMQMYGEFVCAVRFQLEDYARTLLEKIGANAIYSDTDSIIFYDPVDSPLLPTGSNLGDLTDELDGGEIVEIVCAGPKAYAFKWIDSDLYERNRTHLYEDSRDHAR
ncbi:hypothetical protein QR680_004295 [Steinernema hermaphroditum]|uniref:DNA-directed DNA polymerase n=1 Tax=Steinernema hermaphroditum TaxID=289476 RepID=A0AA39HQG1_9BILA|nr:hypothetical protein QR680_004295 [Steinernema hermaphroditum]